MNVSGDVCGEVVSRSLMSKPAAFLSKLTSVKMNKHLCGVKAFVFFLSCSLTANPSCVPLGEMLDIGALDPAKLPRRESKNDFVDLVSRGHEADDGVWVGHNEALDRTMSAMGKILLDPVNGKAISDIDGQLDPAKLPQREFKNVQRCSRSNAEGNAHLQIFLVFFLVWSD